jgi:hypothetical protein
VRTALDLIIVIMAFLVLTSSLGCAENSAQVVPFRRAGNKIVVDAVIENTQESPFNFKFRRALEVDSGAAHTLVYMPWSSVDRMLDHVGEDMEEGYGVGVGGRRHRTYTIPNARIHLAGIVAELDALIIVPYQDDDYVDQKETGYTGLLGSDFLSRYNIHIDRDAEVVRLFKSSREVP